MFAPLSNLLAFRAILILAAAGMLHLHANGGVAAQAFPDGPTKMYVGFPAGGSTDLMAREIAYELEKSWGNPVIVENRGGANGGIAAAQVARMPADGKSLMMVVSGHVTNPLISSTAGYDAIKDFTPIALVASAPLLIFAHPTFPAKNIGSLVALAKSKPESISYATPGAGSIHHLSMELMSSLTGTKFIHVPYRGGGPALNDALAGHVPVSMLSIVQAFPHIQAGRINPLAVTSAQPSASLPNVPSLADVIPGYEAELWYAVIAPAGLRSAIAEKINADIMRAVGSPEMRQKIEKHGARPIGSNRAELAAFMQMESDKWRKVIHDANISEK